MNSNFQQILLAEIGKLLEPVTAAAESPLRLEQVFDEVGWNLDAITGLPVLELQAALGQFLVDYQLLLDLIDHPPETLDDLQAALTAVEGTVKTIRGLGTLMDGPDLIRPPNFEKLGTDLTAFLLYRYLKFHHPAVYLLAVLLTVIRPRKANEFPDPLIDPTSGDVLRFPSAPPAVVEFSQIGELLRNPLAVLKAEYVGTNSLATASDAQAMAEKLFPRLGELLTMVGVHHLFGHDGTDLGAVGNDLASTMLTLFFPLDEDGALSGTAVGATLTLSSADRGNLGLVVTPFGALQFSDAVGSWQLTIQFTASVDAFAIGPAGVVVAGAPGTERVSGEISLQKIATADGKAFLVGSTTGTRLEVGQFGIKVPFRFGPGDVDYGVLVEMGTAAIVVAAGDGDGFLQKVFPKDGLRTNFDLALGWSRQKGIYFRGGAGLEATLPVHASLLDIVTVDSVYLRLRAGAAAGNGAGADINAAAAASVSIQLGPVKASVDRVGIEATFTFPPDGGNLGPANAVVAFKPPTGLGISIDASAVTGGGFISFDYDKGRYTGVLELSIDDIGVKAIGLLDTKLPGGAPGYSFIIIITADFPPITLGFGFTLNGVGGLVGINRTMVTDAIQAGLRNHSVDHVLFPEDPVRDAPQIISDLSTIFPPVEGRYVFGPMALIAWSTPPIVEAELGILIELPDPVHMVLLGQIYAALPNTDEDDPVVELHLDIVGVVDFNKKTVVIDGVLHDSKIAAFDLSGDIALRLNWGDQPAFVFSVGGLNPSFQPPPGFPTLRRVTFALSNSNNPRLTMKAYLAITSNTVQFGALAELYYEAAGFNVSGTLAFDVLLVVSPLSFIANLGASMAVKRGSDLLASVSLRATLTGPTPWHVWGEATFDCIIEITVGFDATIGEAKRTELPAADPGPDLKKALEDARNWSATLPPVAFRVASLTQPSVHQTRGPFFDPLGGATVREKVVPLNRTITRFAETRPLGPGRYTITSVSVGGQAAAIPATVQDYFAPAQFEEMSDAEKLSRPSFEKMDAGFTLADDAVTVGTAIGTDVVFNTIIFDDAPGTPPSRYTMSSDHQLAALGRSASALAPLSSTGSAKFAPPLNAAPPVTLDDEGYVVASVDTLDVEPTLGNAVSKGAAYQALAAYVARNPARKGRVQVMPTHEVAA